MIYDKFDSPVPPGPSGFAPASLPVKPPFLWPDTRYLAKLASYPEMPPMANVVREADLISGVLVDVTKETLNWLHDLLSRNPARRIRLVVVVSPACPTREEHLRELLKLSESQGTEKSSSLEVRILMMSASYGEDCRHAVLPPTTIQAHDSKSGETWTCVGSVGDSGHGPVFTGSLNLVFRSDPALRSAWRKWFQYILSSAAPLNEGTCKIPHLVPPQGTEEAALAWADFMATCAQTGGEESASPTVDPVTGEVIADAEGNPPDPWDGGDTAVEAMAEIFHKIYEEGSLVTVDEGTRIKPFKIPVKAALLGQQAQRNIGNLTQTQTFSLSVLSAIDERELEKCRNINDAMALLTLPLSKGNRFLPNAAKAILDREIEARNTRAKEALKKALGGEDVDDFIKGRLTSIKKDLDQMYKELGQGDAVPDDKLAIVLEEIKTRLTSALNERITPSVVHNNISAPALGTSDPPENWSQPLSLLQHAATRIRESLTDPNFSRSFSKLSFTEEECLQFCNLFSDHLLISQDFKKARKELEQIEQILESDATSRIKCERVLEIVTTGKVKEDVSKSQTPPAPPLPNEEANSKGTKATDDLF